jgi:hypothetical protein
MGLGSVTSGYAVSFLAFVALVPCYLHFAGRLGIHPAVARLGLVLLCLNQALLASASSLLSEPAFTAMTLAALLLVQSSQTEGQGSMATAAMGGAAAGATYWIRYAGVLLIAMLALLCAVRLIQRRWPQFVRGAVSFVTAFLCLAPLLARNEMLVGSCRGYITKDAFHPAGIGKVYVVSMYHLFFGSGLMLQTAPFVAVCLVCVVALGGAAARRQGRPLPISGSILALYAAVYTAGMIYLGVASDITFGGRMFIPLLPVVVLLGAAVFTRWPPAMGPARVITMASILVIAYGVSNLIGSSLTETAARHLDVQSAISGKLRAILDSDPGVLVSADGQAVGYGLGRPVVGLVGTNHGNTRWTEQDVARVMLRYGSCHLLLFPGTNTDDGQQTSPFLSSLAAGRHPSWLRLEAENDRAILYEFKCRSDSPEDRPN